MPDTVSRDLETLLGRLLAAGTYLAVGLVAIGVGLMLVTGRSPLAADAAPLDPAALGRLLDSGRPDTFLWLGLIAAIVTPIGRVTGALLGFAARGERVLVGISAAILLVIATAVALSVLAG
jgi:uncharacterized membrane protein